MKARFPCSLLPATSQGAPSPMKLHLRPKLLAITNHWKEKVLACPKVLPSNCFTVSCDPSPWVTFISAILRLLFGFYCFLFVSLDPENARSQRGRLCHPVWRHRMKALLWHLLCLRAQPPHRLLTLLSPFPMGASPLTALASDKAIDHRMAAATAEPP